MIDLSANRIVRGGIGEDITHWKIWFKTPFGYAESLEEAITTVKSIDLNPHMVVQPIPVAFSETLHEVYDR